MLPCKNVLCYHLLQVSYHARVVAVDSYYATTYVGLFYCYRCYHVFSKIFFDFCRLYCGRCSVLLVCVFDHLVKTGQV